VCLARPVLGCRRRGQDDRDWGVQRGARQLRAKCHRFDWLPLDCHARYTNEGESGARWFAATRRWSHARRLPFTFATPRTEPVRHVLVWNTAALIELLESGLNLIQLPALSLDKGGNGFGRKKTISTGVSASRAPRGVSWYRRRFEPIALSLHRDTWVTGATGLGHRVRAAVTTSLLPFRNVECDSGADQLFERRFLNRVLFVNVDRPPCISFEA
jgi:hypothetical protein